MNKLILTIGFFAVLCKLFDTRAALYGAAAACTGFLIKRLIQFNANLRKVTHIPGKRYLLTPWGSALSFMLPAIPYINAPGFPKINDAMTWRKYYDVAGITITSIVSAFGPRIALLVADDIAIRAIIADRRTFPKPIELYLLLAVYGENVVITEGDEWRKHRKIVAPAFSENTHGLDWTVTRNVVKHWMKDLDRRTKQQQQESEQTAIVIEVDMNKVCLHLSLSILTATVFGITIASPGQTADPVPPGHKHSLKDTLEGAFDRSTLFTTIAAPKWMLEHLPLAHFRRAREVKAELTQWINEIVDQRREALRLGEERKDLLFNLIKANDELQAQQQDLLEKENIDHTNGKAKSEAMDPRELAGNIFVFFLAGHETSELSSCLCEILISRPNITSQSTKDILRLPSYTNLITQLRTHWHSPWAFWHYIQSSKKSYMSRSYPSIRIQRPKSHMQIGHYIHELLRSSMKPCAFIHLLLWYRKQ